MTKLPFSEIYKHDKQVTTKLTEFQYNTLKKYCKKNKIKVSFLIRELINHFLNSENEI